MKTVWKIIGAIFGLLLVAVLIVAFWQKDNISAFITAMRYTPEQLKEQISENDKALKKELEGLLGSKNIRDYTEEEKALIERGEASEKEILAKIIAEQGGWITPASASGDGQIEAEALPRRHKTLAVSQQNQPIQLSAAMSRNSMQWRAVTSPALTVCLTARMRNMSAQPSTIKILRQ